MKVTDFGSTRCGSRTRAARRRKRGAASVTLSARCQRERYKGGRCSVFLDSQRSRFVGIRPKEAAVVSLGGRLDKLGVTGSSPVPPIRRSWKQGLLFCSADDGWDQRASGSDLGKKEG